MHDTKGSYNLPPNSFNLRLFIAGAALFVLIKKRSEVLLLIVLTFWPPLSSLMAHYLHTISFMGGISFVTLWKFDLEECKRVSVAPHLKWWRLFQVSFQRITMHKIISLSTLCWRPWVKFSAVKKGFSKEKIIYGLIRWCRLGKFLKPPI
jgi:hypothetical protein